MQSHLFLLCNRPPFELVLASARMGAGSNLLCENSGGHSLFVCLCHFRFSRILFRKACGAQGPGIRALPEGKPYGVVDTDHLLQNALDVAAPA